MASNVDESPVLRRYLLGELSEAERAGVETRLLTDDGLFEELVLLEEDLIDEYVFGELSPGVRERLETHFAAAPERQEAIRLARMLRQRSQVTESATTARAQLSWRTWGAAAAAALLVGTSV